MDRVERTRILKSEFRFWFKHNKYWCEISEVKDSEFHFLNIKDNECVVVKGANGVLRDDGEPRLLQRTGQSLLWGIHWIGFVEGLYILEDRRKRHYFRNKRIIIKSITKDQLWANENFRDSTDNLGAYGFTGRYTRITEVVWLLSNRKVFLTILDWEVQDEVTSRVKVSIPGWSLVFLSYAHMVEEEELPAVFFMEALIPI